MWAIISAILVGYVGHYQCNISVLYGPLSVLYWWFLLAIISAILVIYVGHYQFYISGLCGPLSVLY